MNSLHICFACLRKDAAAAFPLIIYARVILSQAYQMLSLRQEKVVPHCLDYMTK